MKNHLRAIGGLMLVLAVLVARPLAGYALASGEIAGAMFFDGNGNGVFDADEGGISGVTVKLRNAGTGALVATATTGADGAYRFTGLAPAAYIVAQSNLPGYADTTTSVHTLILHDGGTVAGLNFGDVFPLTLSGYVFEDLNFDGVIGLGEPRMNTAYVGLYRDTNANGALDPNEPRIAYTFTDPQGFYTIPGLLPGACLLVVQPQGGSRQPVAVTLVAYQASGAERRLDVPVQTPQAPAGLVSGIIWNDRDGDELPDSDEPPFAGVSVLVYQDPNTDGLTQEGEAIARTAVTDATGNYALPNLAPGAYVLQVNEGTLPGNYVASVDSSALAFTLDAGEVRRVDVGYYDPLAVAPLRVADWKNELKQAGHPLYTPAQLDRIVADAEAASAVFPEAVGLRDALGMPAKNSQAQARKEFAALRLNLAGGRLLPKTPADLPGITDAQSVGAIVTQLESLLSPGVTQPAEEYRRAKETAEALNKGKGLGYGTQGTAALARATYRAADVTAKLRPGGDTVDQYGDQALYFYQWNTGKYDPAINTFNAALRLTVKAFYNGGVLEVTQRLADGREMSLGMAVPATWNKDVNATFTFYLRNVSTAGDLSGTELRIYVRDPAQGGGPKVHVRVDAAELSFAY